MLDNGVFCQQTDRRIPRDHHLAKAGLTSDVLRQVLKLIA